MKKGGTQLETTSLSYKNVFPVMENQSGTKCSCCETVVNNITYFHNILKDHIWTLVIIFMVQLKNSFITHLSTSWLHWYLSHSSPSTELDMLPLFTTDEDCS